MARPGDATARIRPSTWIGAGAATAALALLVTLAVVWPGYDARQTPVDDPTVWALQTGAGSGYARVNLELGEVDTVKQVENGTQLAQTADRLFVFRDGGSSYADVDLASPADLTGEDDDRFSPTPPGTVDIVSADDAIVYRTDGGAVFAATLSGGGAAVPVDPDAGEDSPEDAPRFAASAVAVDADGIVYAYSPAASLVVRAEARTGRVLAHERTPIAPAEAQLSAVGGRWVLLDTATGAVAVQGRDDVVETPVVAAPVLQRAATTGSDAYIADPTGVTRVPLAGGAAERVVDGPGLGVPAAPVAVGGDVHAAWLGDGTAGGTLWSSARPDERTVLDYAGVDIGDSVDPVFVGTGTHLALNDRSAGWVWQVPSGELVPSSQQWRLDEVTEAERQTERTAERVLDPKPPVAEDDAFGVRAGSVALLPVLLNDHDPNEDVLSLDASSLEGLDPAFGTLTVTGADQQLALAVAPDAVGSATFRYRVTDGTAANGLFSETATVTVRVVPDEENAAPVWCGVEGCRQSWPTLSVAPGGTVSADLLNGWVDPDGDPVYLAGVEAPPAVGTAATSPDGELTYQHPDPGQTEATTVQVGVVVSDARGAATTQPLTIEVTPAPRLEAESFAVTAVAGETVEVDVAPWVTGAAGPAGLGSVVALDTTGVTATPAAAPLTMSIRASDPGSTLVQYTVRDDVGEASAVVRVTVQDPADTAVTTPPLTAFVRPGEDATIDVASAATNPAGLVLLLDDIRPQGDPTASLGVDLVGQSLLRVSGTTDDGAPGRLGVVRYRLTDGKDAVADGELTVILLDAGSAEPPIAVDDAVTVRAGAQVDIPVLDNDRAPAGSVLALDPTSIVDETGGGLAFASGRTLRYLAPSAPGTYAVTYAAYRLGFPEAADTARVIVTVTGGDENRAPVPRTLVGRVVAGQAVTIPFASTAVDPDGDEVLLDAVLEQPADGSAAVSADGRSIVYTSTEGTTGQVRFAYQVRDARGATGRADVRVGVIARQSDPSPVTFSDYVQVQAGERNTVVVRPADNDVDPFDRPLELTEVTPNAPAGSPEFDALASRVVSVQDGAVTIEAGTALGTSSYGYTVANEDGDTAIGMIVVKTVRDPVPDHPVVTDTVLTAEDRDRFPDGVDVLRGRVSWTGGDPADLRLRLWGDQDDLDVQGWEVSGPLPERARLIPFEVSGTAFDGADVVTYGFLRVPGEADLRLTLRDGLPPLQVDEGGEVSVDVAGAVAVPAGRELVLDGVRAGGARADASCRIVAGTTVRYTAGRGAPWTDSCVVEARLTGPDAGPEGAAVLSLPVQVRAEIPQPVLRSASLAVRPGETATFDLARMVRWEGDGADAALRIATQYRGDQFAIEATGTRLTVTAADDARPGREESVAVTLPSHPDTAGASLVVTVGPSPSTLPRGGSAVQACSQSGGASSCTIDVLGADGEVNPLPGTPLRVVSADAAGTCAGVRFQPAGDRAVRASWSTDAAGAARCVGSFVVEDAQGRRSSGDRNGTVVLDLRGLPADPTRVEWTGYGPESVTLRVTSASASYPAVDGYRITAGGREVATCPASGVCAPIAAPVGERRVYQAQAVNAVGASRGTVRTEAWAYRAPARPAGVRVDPVPNGDAGGRATIVVSGLDDTTGGVRLTGGAAGGAVERVSGGTATFTGYDVGSNDPVPLTATPLTDFALPPIAGGSSEGRALTFRAHGVGAPGIELTQTTTADSMTVSVRVTSESAGVETLLGYSRTAAECVPDTTERTATVAAAAFESTTVHVCATSRYDGRDGFGITRSEITARPVGAIPAPADLTFSVSPRPVQDGDAYVYAVADAPDAGRAPFPDADLRYWLNGARQEGFAPRLNQPGDRWTAAWCDGFAGGDGACSEQVAVTPEAGSAAYPIRIDTADAPSCRSDRPAPDWRPAGFGADVAAVERDVRGGDAPTRVEWTVRWTGALEGLERITVRRDCEQIEPEPTPTPAPTPTPTPTGTPAG